MTTAFETTAERYRRRVFTFARSLLSNREEAEEVTQDVLLRLWRHQQRVDEERLGSWLLRDDPDFAKLMAGLKAIRVQVYPLKDKAGAEPLRAKIDHTVHWMESHGWHSTVRVHDKGQETYIYLKEADGRMVGLAILSVEPGQEAALINIVGTLDPAQLGRIGRGLDIPQLQKAQPRSGGKHEP
jgi:hypothetical protein